MRARVERRARVESRAAGLCGCRSSRPDLLTHHSILTTHHSPLTTQSCESSKVEKRAGQAVSALLCLPRKGLGSSDSHSIPTTHQSPLNHFRNRKTSRSEWGTEYLRTVGSDRSFA